MSMLRQHHLPGPAMLRRPLRHGPYVMSSEGLVIHLGQLTPLTPADSTVQRPAVSSRGSVNGVCHTAAQIFHILPQILAANRLDAQWRRANLARNKEVSLVKWHFRRHVPHFSHSVLVPVAWQTEGVRAWKLLVTAKPTTRQQTVAIIQPGQAVAAAKLLLHWSPPNAAGRASSDAIPRENAPEKCVKWKGWVNKLDFKLPATTVIPDIKRTCGGWRGTDTVGWGGLSRLKVVLSSSLPVFFRGYGLASEDPQPSASHLAVDLAAMAKQGSWASQASRASWASLGLVDPFPHALGEGPWLNVAGSCTNCLKHLKMSNELVATLLLHFCKCTCDLMSSFCHGVFKRKAVGGSNAFPPGTTLPICRKPPCQLVQNWVCCRTALKPTPCSGRWGSSSQAFNEEILPFPSRSSPRRFGFGTSATLHKRPPGARSPKPCGRNEIKLTSL